MPIINMVYKKKKWKYSYTFKGKTSTQIWNDWNLLTWTIQTNSDWVCWSSNTDCRIKVDIPSLATAKKITISWTYVVNSRRPANNACSFWIWSWSWWGTTSVSWSLQWTTYTWIWAQFYDWTTYNWNVVGYASQWTYNPITIIDLVNKTITMELSWFNNSVVTLTDSQINTIKQMTYLFVYISVNNSAMSDVSIKIE